MTIKLKNMDIFMLYSYCCEAKSSNTSGAIFMEPEFENQFYRWWKCSTHALNLISRFHFISFFLRIDQIGNWNLKFELFNGVTLPSLFESTLNMTGPKKLFHLLSVSLLIINRFYYCHWTWYCGILWINELMNILSQPYQHDRAETYSSNDEEKLSAWNKFNRQNLNIVVELKNFAPIVH